MTAAQLLDLLALPVGLILSALASWVLTLAAVYLRERTTNARLSRLCGALGRIAGTVHDTLATLPATANAANVKARLIEAGVNTAKSNVAGTIAALGASDATLDGMLRGEVGKLSAIAATPPAVAAIVTKAPDR
jgi:hypothetical protein